MSWVRIDDKAWSHPKFASLSGNAARLWMFGLCWCNQQETDGFVPRSMLKTLRGSPADAAGLVAAGLWVEEPEGWRFHDYLAYQPSKNELENKRTSTKERVSRFRERSRNAVTPATGNADGNAPVTLPPTQPNPTQPVQEKEREAGKPPPRPKLLRWRKVPAGWEPNDAHRELARELGVDLTRQLALFRDHEFKDPKSDADAAFRTWLRRAGEYSQPRAAGGGGGSSLPLLMARIQRMEAEDEGN